MRTLLIMFSLLSPIISHGQSFDSLKILSSSEWRTEGKWFGADTVVLVTNEYPDTTNWSLEEKLIWMNENRFVERIRFDSTGAIKYYSNIPYCGNTVLQELKRIQFEKGQLKVYYSEGWYSEPKKEYFNLYDVKFWTKEQIILVKHKIE